MYNAWKSVIKNRRLFTLQSGNHGAHLFITVDSKPAFTRDAGKLHILRIQLFFHNLLERLQHQRLGFL